MRGGVDTRIVILPFSFSFSVSSFSFLVFFVGRFREVQFVVVGSDCRNFALYLTKRIEKLCLEVSD